MKLAGEIALVTGASRGIGRAIAQRLGEHGAFVIGTATTETGVTGIADFFAAGKLAGVGLVLDVSDDASVAALFEQLKQQSRLPSVVVNNAGITRDNLLVRMDATEWAEVIDTNLSSLYRIARRAARAMMKARKGRIINITSVVGATGNAGQVNYAAAKAGMMGFTRALAKELGPRNITVNAVAPGFIDTDMTSYLTPDQRTQLLEQIPLNRLGTPEDIADAVVFLAGPGATYITGTTLHVNGGLYTS